MRSTFALTLSLLAVPLAAQDILYGVRGGNTLVLVDTSTLVATDVGPIGFSQIGGLAVGNDGTLYGITTNTDELIRIDRTTGAGTSIGPAGLAITFSTGLAGDPMTGSLFGVAQGGVGPSSRLVRFDRATGAATVIGDMAGNSTTAVVGLDADRSGQLWGIDGGGGHEELIRIDKNTAAVTVVGAGSLGGFPSIGCFDIGPSGVAWAVHSVSPNYTLLRIDLATGAPTAVGNLTGIPFSTNFTGLASESCPQFAPLQAQRAGTPANPLAFVAGTTPPSLGMVWNPVVDHTTFVPSALLDFMVLANGRTNVPSPFGTLLCDLSVHVLVTKPPTAAFALPIPNSCLFAGISLCTQAGSTDGVLVRVANALDLRIGTF